MDRTFEHVLLVEHPDAERKFDFDWNVVIERFAADENNDDWNVDELISELINTGWQIIKPQLVEVDY